MKRYTAILSILVLLLAQGCNYLAPVAPTTSPTSSAPTEPGQAPTTLAPVAPTAENPPAGASPTPAALDTATPTEPLTPSPAKPLLTPAFYSLQPGTPVAISGFPHPERGCTWMGIGGQVFDYFSNPIEFLVVSLRGSLDGKDVDELSLTGTAKAWGPGGYEFNLSDHPIESNGTLFLQFFDLAGNTVSDPIYLTTYNDCDRNTILVNLQQVRSGSYRLILPVVPNQANP